MNLLLTRLSGPLSLIPTTSFPESLRTSIASIVRTRVACVLMVWRTMRRIAAVSARDRRCSGGWVDSGDSDGR